MSITAWENFAHKKLVIRLVKIAVTLFVLFWLAFFALFFSVKWGLFGKLPTNEELRNIKNPIASEVYTAEGELLGRYYRENRSNVQYDEISDYLIKALVATEDSRFFEHKGVDSRSVMRVIVKSILLGDRSSGGGSTLSQQLVKNLYPRKYVPVIGMLVIKIKEALVARKLEKIYDKEEIITLYLNTVPFGERIYGIGMASSRFFNKTPNELSLSEATTLIGMLKANTTYNPRLNLAKSQQRRDVVINQMVKKGYVSESIAAKAKGESLRIDYTKGNALGGIAPYVRLALREELQTWCKENLKIDGTPYDIYADGLKIYTTIDAGMQKYAEQAVMSHWKKMQNLFEKETRNLGERSWLGNSEILKKGIRQSHRYKTMKEAGASEAEIEATFAQPTALRILTTRGVQQVDMSPRDSVIHQAGMLNASMMVMDPFSGHVKAWVGGVDAHYFGHDKVIGKRQVGSTFKPLVYAAAIENGYTPCSYFPNEKTSYPDYKDWTPENSDDEYGGFYALRAAMARSVNVIAAQLILKTGIGKVVKLAERTGVETSIPELPSIALGTAELSLWEMLRPYCSFVNGGYQTRPIFLSRIEDSKGRVLANFENPDHKRRPKAMSGATAATMVEMLQEVTDYGTASSLRSEYGLRMDIAGKTGTTQNKSDGWFIGFTPRLVAGAWMGAEDRRVHFRDSPYGSGATVALPIWADFMSSLKDDPDYERYVMASFPTMSPELIDRFDCEKFAQQAPQGALAETLDDIGGVDAKPGHPVGGETDAQTGASGDANASNGSEQEADNRSWWQKTKDGIFGRKKKKKDQASQSGQGSQGGQGGQSGQSGQGGQSGQSGQGGQSGQAGQAGQSGPSSLHNWGLMPDFSKVTDCSTEVIPSEFCNSKQAPSSVRGYRENYFPNSRKVESTGSYDRGLQQGHWKFYYRNGLLKIEGNFENAKANGYWKEFYENGRVRSEGNYQDCKKTGWWKYFHEDGSVKAEGNYKNSVKVGQWKFWDASRQMREVVLCN